MYLLKISVTHHKNHNPLLNLLTNCISVRSAPQLLSMKDQYTFHFFKFSNNSVNSLLGIISFLIVPPEADLSASN